MLCTVAISYIAHKWQQSLNKIHAHGNNVKSVKRKQICTFSDKWEWIVREIIKDAGNKEKKNAKSLSHAQDYHKTQTAVSQ